MIAPKMLDRNRQIFAARTSLADMLAETAAAAPDAITVMARRLGRLIAEALERDRQRRTLARLDDRLLRDIGVTRAQAKREAAKPFWRR